MQFPQSSTNTVYICYNGGILKWLKRPVLKTERSERARGFKSYCLRHTWRDVRVVERTGFENRRTEKYRGFESHSLLHQFTRVSELADEGDLKSSDLVSYGFDSRLWYQGELAERSKAAPC